MESGYISAEMTETTETTSAESPSEYELLLSIERYSGLIFGFLVIAVTVFAVFTVIGKWFYPDV